MSLVLLLLLAVWAVAVGGALVVARTRLGREGATFRDELVARGFALVALSVALSAMGLAAALFTASTDVLLLMPVLWAVSAAPLAVPPLRRRDGSERVSSFGWVLTSVLLSASSAPVLALFVLVRLILTNPEIV